KINLNNLQRFIICAFNTSSIIMKINYKKINSPTFLY
ncbi:hypothetical protein FHR25_005295, partial [Yokenella regensburgei]